MTDLKLGLEVTEAVTGLEGILICRCDRLHQGTQWGVQPKGDGKTVPEAHFFDGPTLSADTAGVSAEAKTPATYSIKLGDKATDKITGFKGTVTEIFTYLDGCVCYYIVGRINKKNDKAPSVLLAAERLEGNVVIVGPVVKKPGGASRKMPRAYVNDGRTYDDDRKIPLGRS